MHLLIAAVRAPSPDTPPSSLEGGAGSALVVVGVVAALFVGYLAADWLKTRRAARKLTLKKRLAREAWQQEIDDNNSGRS